RLVNGALVGDLEQSCSLFVAQIPVQLDLSLDAIEHALFRLAVRAIDRVDPRVPQSYRDRIELPRLASRVHRQGHGRAGSESTQQEIVGTGPGIGSSN